MDNVMPSVQRPLKLITKWNKSFHCARHALLKAVLVRQSHRTNYYYATSKQERESYSEIQFHILFIFYACLPQFNKAFWAKRRIRATTKREMKGKISFTYYITNYLLAL